jgi:glycosyltransferase involved in cell wall biosynthesis
MVPLESVNMKKILIIQSCILHYRKAFFNELSKTFDVTVIHSGKATVGAGDHYNEILVSRIKMGPFFIQKNLWSSFESGRYDVVVAEGNARYISSIFLSFFKKSKCRFGFWGTYMGKNYVINTFWKYYTRYASVFHLFYSKRDMEVFEKFSVGKEKLYLANNTFHVQNRVKSYSEKFKNTILFVGSLDTRKEINILIEAFSEILHSIPEYIELAIIGEGVEYQNLKYQVTQLLLNDRIKFYRSITNPKILEEFYNRAYFSVSFGQAGLSVLQSFAYGVPFITKVDAISGGEKTNIIDGFNGFFCDGSQSDLEMKLMLLCNDLQKARKMGENAFEYYSNNCTIEIMANGFIEAAKLKTN